MRELGVSGQKILKQFFIEITFRLRQDTFNRVLVNFIHITGLVLDRGLFFFN